MGIYRGKFYVTCGVRKARAKGFGLGWRHIVESVFWESRKCRTRINTHVDDPWTSMCGNQTCIRYASSSLICGLDLGLLLGFGEKSIGEINRVRWPQDRLLRVACGLRSQ